MRLLLIRHAQSANNALPEEQRVEDPPITQLGHRQAAALGTWLTSAGVDRLITSPFRRSLETTEYVRRQLGLVPQIWIDIHEQGGCYSGYEPGCYLGRPGMSHEQIAAEFPDYELDPGIDHQGWWKSRPYETHGAARERARRMISRAYSSFAGTAETVAMVMHADFKRLVLSEMFSEPPRIDDWLISIYNTAVTTIEMQASTPRLLRYNATEHLEPEMLSC